MVAPLSDILLQAERYAAPQKAVNPFVTLLCDSHVDKLLEKRTFRVYAQALQLTNQWGLLQECDNHFRGTAFRCAKWGLVLEETGLFRHISYSGVVLLPWNEMTKKQSEISCCVVPAQVLR